jgi:hypothetical protein
MKKVIKLTESQLKKLILEQTVGVTDQDMVVDKPNDPNDMSKTANRIKKQWGDKVMEFYKNSPDYLFKMSLDGGDYMLFWPLTNLCSYNTKYHEETKGKIVPYGASEFKLVLEDGDVYDSASEKWTSTSTTPKPCANQLVDTSNGSLLKFGCKTQGVKELQTLLDFKNPTGYFGKITRQRVINFQKTNNLKVDGIVGPETYKALAPNAVTPSTQDIDEYNDIEDDDYNELDNLFTNNFDTEDDYDGEPLRGDDEGFSNKMRVKQIQKSIKLGDTNMDSGRYMAKDMKKNRENEKRRYAGLDPLRNDTQPKPYSPIKNDDLPLDKYLEKKRMKDLDEDEDIAMLDSLFDKDETMSTEMNEQSGGTYEQIKAEWSKVNSDDDTSTKGFGEGKSPNESMAKRMGQMNARAIVAKKAAGLKPSDNKPFDQSVSASEIDGKMYRIGNVYNYLCLMDKN